MKRQTADMHTPYWGGVYTLGMFLRFLCSLFCVRLLSFSN